MLAPDDTAFTAILTGLALASRHLMQELREAGMVTGGPKPFAARDQSALLGALDPVVVRVRRLTESGIERSVGGEFLGSAEVSFHPWLVCLTVKGSPLRSSYMPFLLVAVLLMALAIGPTAGASDLAAGGTLRAVYLGSNPAQAMRDASTGQVRGASHDLAQELAGRHGLKLEFRPVDDPPAVIEAVRTGAADIGFVAYEATRLGTVDFSQPYMLVRQSFLVLDSSPIRSVADIDRAGQTIGGTRNDSITLCMKRILRQAQVAEVANGPAELGRALTGRAVDALGANRQRLTALMKVTPGTRLLPDDLFNVPQNVVVPKDRPVALAAINALIDELRASGIMQSAIEQGGAVGVVVAPAGARAGCP